MIAEVIIGQSAVAVVAAAAAAAIAADALPVVFSVALLRLATGGDRSRESALRFVAIARLTKDENNAVGGPGILEDDRLLP